MIRICIWRWRRRATRGSFFNIPLDLARSGKELIFDLANETQGQMNRPRTQMVKLPNDPNAVLEPTSRVDLGYPLVIQIPQSAVRDRLAQFYHERGNLLSEICPRTNPNSPLNDEIYEIDDMSMWLYYHPKWEPEVQEEFFAISSATFQSLKADQEGKVFQRGFSFSEGVRFTSGTMTLNVDRVPPGRYALRINGGYFCAHETGQGSTGA